MKTLLALLILGLVARSTPQTQAPDMTTMDFMGGGGGGGGGGAGAPGAPPRIGGISISSAGIKLRDIKNLGRGSFAASIGALSQSQQDSACQGVIRGGGDKELLDALRRAGVDCVAAARRDPSFRATGSQALQVVNQLRETSAPSNWGTSDWSMLVKRMPDAVRGSDFRQISGANVRTLVESGDLQGSTAFERPAEKRALDSQLQSAYGQPNTWTSDTFSKMGSLMKELDVSTLKSMDPTQMRAGAANFRNLEFDNPAKRAAVGKQLIAGLGPDSSSWTSDDITNAGSYIRNNRRIIDNLDDSTFRGSVADLGSRQTDKRGASQLSRKMKSLPEFSDPTQVNSSQLENMFHLLQGVGPDYLRRLPPAAVNGALGAIGNVSFARGDARAIMANIKGTPSSYTETKVRELKNLMTGLEPTDLEAIDPSVVAGTLDELADKDFDVSQCRAIVKQVKSAGNSNMRKMGALMKKCMTPDDVESVTLDDLSMDCSSSTAPSITPDKAMAKKIMAKIKERFGPVNSSNTNYTLTCMQNFGKAAALGMDPTDIADLPDTGDLTNVFGELASHEDEMDDGQTKAAALRLRTHLDLDNETAVMAIDSATIESVGKFLKHFNDSDLQRFNSSLRPEIARKIGEANLDNLPSSEITRLKNFALKHVLRDDTSAVTDRTGSSSLDDNDIRDLGNLGRGLETADVNKMAGAAITANMNTMQRQVRSKAVKTAVVSRGVSEVSEFLDSSDNLIGMSGFIGGMSSSQIQGINSTIMGEALADVATQLESRATTDTKRDNAGYKGEVSDADRSSMQASVSEFVVRGFNGMLQAGQASASRRKRNTPAVTCSDIQVLGSNAVSLTTTQIDSLTDSEFTDCVETLGAITGWSTAQLSSLVSRAKSAYNGTSTWSSSNIRLIGTITAGLTSAEIGTLALSSASILTTMGTSSAFSSAQLQAGFNRYLTLARASTASSVTGDDLIALGNFACGASTSNIASFTSSNYKTAASAIGSLTTCDSSQLGAYADLAKTAYGQPSTWDSATITTLGTVIGGLSASELGSLTSTQIASISTTTIAAIPPANFAGFSSSQLAGFSTAQANAVTSSQQNALSVDQRNSLISAGATDLSTSSADVIRASVLMLLPVLALLL